MTIVVPRFKVCCIADVAEARLAVDAGAAALGLVSAMPSGPGVVPEARIAEIAASVPPGVLTVLLTSETDVDRIVAQQRRCGTGALQICAPLDVVELAELRDALPGIDVIPVVHVRDASSIALAETFAATADALLLDTGQPDPATGEVRELGGTGRTHDWSISRAIRERVAVPVFLAGGLRPDNVAEAVRAVRPFGVDICSGLRTSDRLDPNRLAEFARALGSVAVSRSIATVTVVVADYDAAIAFYRDVLGFELISDEPTEGKRWVVVAPPGGRGTRLLLARAKGLAQAARIGDQTGDRVAFFLETDDFARDFSAMAARGVRFLEVPRDEPYGRVVVFEDIAGNRWDLIQPDSSSIA